MCATTIRPLSSLISISEEVVNREVSEAEEAALVNALRGDFHDIFAFALLSGIGETGCALWSAAR
jgi:hypothetical protein